MKRTLIAITTVLLVAATGCQTARPTAWFLSGADIDSSVNEYIGRIGIESQDEKGEPVTEFGLQSDWIGATGGRQKYGVYALWFVPFGENVLGRQFAGYATTIDWDHEEGGYYGPVAGTIRPINENISALVQYSYRDFTALEHSSSDVHLVSGGVRWKF